MALLEDYLYSEEFLFEGEQAEKYLKNKLDKKRENEKVEEARQRYREGSESKGSELNPAYQKARRIRGYRSKYDEVIPKALSNGEKKLAKAEEKDSKARAYGYNIKQRLDDEGKHDSGEIFRAGDAAMRHYRRTHRNESAEVELYEGAIDLI